MSHLQAACYDTRKEGRDWFMMADYNASRKTLHKLANT